MRLLDDMHSYSLYDTGEKFLKIPKKNKKTSPFYKNSYRHLKSSQLRYIPIHCGNGGGTRNNK